VHVPIEIAGQEKRGIYLLGFQHTDDRRQTISELITGKYQCDFVGGLVTTDNGAAKLRNTFLRNSLAHEQEAKEHYGYLFHPLLIMLIPLSVAIRPASLPTAVSQPKLLQPVG